MALSPADDVLIRVERPLDLGSDAQLVASVLSKKIAARATHPLIDIPVVPIAKVRSDEDFHRLRLLMEQVADATRLNLRILRTQSQPVGRGIARRWKRATCSPCCGVPRMRQWTCTCARWPWPPSCWNSAATHVPVSDRPRPSACSTPALLRPISTPSPKGALREPPLAALREPILATTVGDVVSIDNRRLACVAKLAATPSAAAAGLDLHLRLGERVKPCLGCHYC